MTSSLAQSWLLVLWETNKCHFLLRGNGRDPETVAETYTCNTCTWICLNHLACTCTCTMVHVHVEHHTAYFTRQIHVLKSVKTWRGNSRGTWKKNWPFGDRSCEYDINTSSTRMYLYIRILMQYCTTKLNFNFANILWRTVWGINRQTKCFQISHAIHWAI